MLPNLAGNSFANETIRHELETSGISVVEVTSNIASNPDVKASIIGRLGEFTFRRAWCYYVVNGPVPIEVAWKLYHDPAGINIRVAGHCCRVSPESPWVSWYLPNGIRVLSMEEHRECMSYLTCMSKLMGEAAGHVLANHAFSDEPKSLGAHEFVNLYHIDSEVGLRVFADAVKNLAIK